MGTEIFLPLLHYAPDSIATLIEQLSSLQTVRTEAASMAASRATTIGGGIEFQEFGDVPLSASKATLQEEGNVITHRKAKGSSSNSASSLDFLLEKIPLDVEVQVSIGEFTITKVQTAGKSIQIDENRVDDSKSSRKPTWPYHTVAIDSVVGLPPARHAQSRLRYAETPENALHNV